MRGAKSGSDVETDPAIEEGLWSLLNDKAPKTHAEWLKAIHCYTVL